MLSLASAVLRQRECDAGRSSGGRGRDAGRPASVSRLFVRLQAL